MAGDTSTSVTFFITNINSSSGQLPWFSSAVHHLGCILFLPYILKHVQRTTKVGKKHSKLIGYVNTCLPFVHLKARQKKKYSPKIYSYF